MGQTNSLRVSVQEGAYTFISDNLAHLLKEIDARLNGANCFIKITRTSNLISKIEYFHDPAKLPANLMAEADITYTDGQITGKTMIFYNSPGGPEDSRVTTTITRNSEGQITSCDNVFSTSESVKI